jgi:hypothetical protein
MTIWCNPRTLVIAALLLAAAPAAGQQAGPARRHAPGHEPGLMPPLSPAMQSSLMKPDTVGVPWVDDAELGPGQWKADGMWHWMYRPQRIKVLSPTIYPNLVVYPDSGVLPPAFSGNAAFWFGEDSNGTFIGNDFDRSQFMLSGGNSTHIITGSLVTPPINLFGQQAVVLSFMTWWEIEGVDTYAFDLMQVEASSNAGLSWQPLGRGRLNPLNDVNGEAWKAYSSGGLGKRGEWVRQIFDLSSFAGGVVIIRFRFDSGDLQYNGFRGWMIDDISVTPTVMGPPTILAVSPTVVTADHVVTLLGTNFVNGATVQIDTIIVPTSVLGSTVALFSVPFGTPPGTYNLRLTNPDGQFGNRLRALTVSVNVPPSIILIMPDSAAAGTSVPFTIVGDHFRAGVAVDIGGVAIPPTSLILTDSTQIAGTTPFTLPTGLHNVRVTNPDGLSDLLVLGFTVFIPQISISALGDSVAGRSQGFNIVPPLGTVFSTGVLYYRAGGTRAYDSLALQNVTGQFRGSIPAAATTIRGIEYWVELRSLAGASMTFPLVNPAGSPAIYPVRTASALSPHAGTQARYRMVSTPLDLSVPGVLAQFGDDFGVYNPARWRFFRWERGDYHEFPRITAPLVPGNAFWLVTATGTGFDFKGGTSVNTSQSYYVALDTGWNQIGNPFAFPVAWGSIGIGGNVTGPYAYDGFQYRIDSIIVPFTGYFVRNNSTAPGQLLVPPLEANLFIGKASGTASTTAPGEFLLQISAQLPGTEYRDSYNYVGLRPGAAAGRDDYDAPKPPPIGDGLEVTILEGGIAYLHNFKPLGDEGQSWVVALRGHGLQGKALVTLTRAGTLPPGYELHVLDLTQENAVPAPAGTFEALLTAPGTPHLYKVIVGTPVFAARESDGIPLQPVAYALEQNFPNPFNPETTIRFALAKKTDVSLEIFNTLGQRVRTLASGVHATGVYDVRWDGSNDRGNRTASGVYFYRLRTDDYTAVRKLVLIR